MEIPVSISKKQFDELTSALAAIQNQLANQETMIKQCLANQETTQNKLQDCLANQQTMQDNLINHLKSQDKDLENLIKVANWLKQHTEYIHKNTLNTFEMLFPIFKKFEREDFK